MFPLSQSATLTRFKLAIPLPASLHALPAAVTAAGSSGVKYYMAYVVSCRRPASQSQRTQTAAIEQKAQCYFVIAIHPISCQNTAGISNIDTVCF